MGPDKTNDCRKINFRQIADNIKIATFSEAVYERCVQSRTVPNANARSFELEEIMEAIVTSVNDAAKALSVGRTSIYVLIRTGRLVTVKLGRRTLITTDSIRKLIAGK